MSLKLAIYWNPSGKRKPPDRQQVVFKETLVMAHRIERINNLIRRELSELLQRQVKDPRLGTFTAVTAVSTSPDLKYAKVFVSCISSEEEKQQKLTALTSAAGFFRKEIPWNS